MNQELSTKEMIEVCKVYEYRFGKNNWCLTKHPRCLFLLLGFQFGPFLSDKAISEEDSSTKLIVRDRGGYVPALDISDETLKAVNEHYGIDREEGFKILLSTMQGGE